MGQVEEQRAVLEEALPEAVKTLIEIMRKPGRNSQTQLAAVKTILDRAGLPVVERSEVNVDIADSLAERLIAARKRVNQEPK